MPMPAERILLKAQRAVLVAFLQGYLAGRCGQHRDFSARGESFHPWRTGTSGWFAYWSGHSAGLNRYQEALHGAFCSCCD